MAIGEAGSTTRAVKSAKQAGNKAPRRLNGQTLPSPISASKAVRTRFLKKLRLHGIAGHAALEVGVSISALYRARAKFSDFAKDWDAVIAQLPESAHPGLEEWGKRTRQIFLSELTITASPVRAAQRVKRSLLGALRLRGRSTQFAKQWDAAMARALLLIEAEVHARVLNGVQFGARQGGKANPDGVASVVHSDRLTMFILRAMLPETYDRPRGSALMQRSGPTMSRAGLIAHLKQIAERIATDDTAYGLEQRPVTALVNEPDYARSQPGLTPGDDYDGVDPGCNAVPGAAA